MTVIFGVCMSLGLGAMNVDHGMQRFGNGLYRGWSYNTPDDQK